MRTLREIKTIVVRMNDEVFETLTENYIDAWSGNRKAKATYEKALTMASLTDEEWAEWCAC